MRDIQMVDLKSQYQKLRPQIDSAVISVMESSAFIKGPDVGFLEEELKEYMGVSHVVSCANGTDALQLALMALALKPGDEVITTNFTFICHLLNRNVLYSCTLCWFEHSLCHFHLLIF